MKSIRRLLPLVWAHVSLHGVDLQRFLEEKRCICARTQRLVQSGFHVGLLDVLLCDHQCRGQPLYWHQAPERMAILAGREGSGPRDCATTV